MASQGLQILGILLSFIGWLGTIVACALPMWRVTAFVGANIVTAQIIWEGLWMNCVVQSTGQMQCKVYDSLLALPQDLQAARAMVIISIIIGVFGTLMAVVGGKCTNFIQPQHSICWVFHLDIKKLRVGEEEHISVKTTCPAMLIEILEEF
uniref:Claudin n=1 Tax=Nothobranchius furzeri TaxID=105023 RepID=A0A8C6NN19_NOTFU